MIATEVGAPADHRRRGAPGGDALLGWMAYDRDDGGGGVDPAEEVRRRLALRLPSMGRSSFPRNVVVALMTGFVAWDALPKVPLGLWVAAIAVAAWVRGMAPAWVGRKGGGTDDIQRAHLLVTATLGIVWGIGLIALGPALDLPRLLLIVAILSGLVTGCAVSMAAHPTAFFTFASIMFGSVTVTVFAHGTTQLHWMLAVFIVGSFWWMSQLMHGTHTAIVEGLSAAIELEAHERKASQDSAILRALLESISDAILVVRYDDTILGVNPAFERMFGWTPEEARGKDVVDLLVPSEDLEEVRDLSRTLKKGRARIRVAPRRARDGTTVWTRISASPIRGRTGEAVILYADITAEKEAEAALEEAKEMAEAANRAKSEFLATMSHEIRTPMNAIIGMAELLSEEELTPAQRDYVEVFRTAGDTLLTLINQVLDLAKIESGHIELDVQDFDLWELVERTAQVFALPAHQKGVELAARVDPDVRRWVRGDPDRLREVLANLLGNAVKFTEAGEVVLAVTRVGSGGGSGEAEAIEVGFSVRDTGTGIPPDRKAAIFERFTQADSSTTRKFGGSGLGLTISQAVVSLMGGRIEVESELGVGSTFAFTVLLRPSDVREVAPLSEATTGSVQGLKVLVVDDNATNRLILQEILTAWGSLVTAASDGPDALDRMRRAHELGTPYELVILDGQMPGMDGFSVAERIQREPDLSGPTLMMLTSGGSHARDVRRARELGIGSYLLKPVRRAELLQAVLEALGVSREPVRPILENGAGDGVGARILLADDTPENRMLIERYLAKSSHDLRTVESGEDAVDAYVRDPAAFDLVLMDIRMPGIDGYEATRRMRAFEREFGRDPIPIVALTAHALETEQRKSLEVGCDAHLTKPIKKKRLLSAISELARS